MLDIYCERLGPGIWAEPLNLLTNLAFFVAGALTLRLFLQQPDRNLRRRWDLLALVLLLFAIGFGSGLWHGFATRWAVLADVVPITLLINLFLLSFLVRVAALPWWWVLGIFLTYQGLGFGLLSVAPPDALNGSIAYLPALMFLIGIWGWLIVRAHPLASTFGLATGLFTVSLTFRTLDSDLCGSFPLGTHFLWHLLNGWVLYLLVGGLIREGGSRVRSMPGA
jgi:hypothetical protein